MRHRNFVTLVNGVRAAVVVAAAGLLMSQAFAQAPAPKAQPKRLFPNQPKGGEGARTAAGRAAQAELLTLDESVSEGPGGERQGSLPDRPRRRGRDGLPVVAAVLIEPEGEPRKTLRVTLPLGMALQPARVVIDEVSR
jgi:hypothetical protein